MMKHLSLRGIQGRRFRVKTPRGNVRLKLKLLKIPVLNPAWGARLRACRDKGLGFRV